ncbi:hypothetical protein [Pygmaiobacter massiliensis]|uniref:hypothetical protein n=1 Tax=Pygmaiobacter massiliensis TaxID=1917873 RepID=UPI002A7F3074|nr:hypothetical protein [Pygmaiobacter massiliensis]MDY4784150.1 hypothetical protein [Pygmaiobacter massiliensis]
MSTQISSAAPWLNPIETINESEIHLAPLLHTSKAANASFAELLSLRHQLELRSAAKRGQVHLVRPPVTSCCNDAPDPRYAEISLASLRKDISQRLLLSQLSLN